jgi:hypothetical protein
MGACCAQPTRGICRPPPNRLTNGGFFWPSGRWAAAQIGHATRARSRGRFPQPLAAGGEEANCHRDRSRESRRKPEGTSGLESRPAVEG